MPGYEPQIARSLVPNAPLIATLAALALLVSAPAASQIRASERASVSQTVDGTTVTIDYARPSARGRALFGELVPWGGVWTPGANWATTLTVDADVRVNGVDVPAGTYSVWATPRPERFTVTLDDDAELMHYMKPDSVAGQIHLSAVPQEGVHTEFLTWSFPNVRGDAAVLELRWGTTVVPLEVWVQPSRPLTLDADERDRYVGDYEMEMTPESELPETGIFEVFEEDGLLRGRLPFGIHPEDDRVFDLVPAGEGRFNPGLYRDGEFFGVELAVNIDFEGGIGRARRVVWRGPLGTLFGSGDRATQDR